jgi:hypothetical protein
MGLPNICLDLRFDDFDYSIFFIILRSQCQTSDTPITLSELKDKRIGWQMAYFPLFCIDGVEDHRYLFLKKEKLNIFIGKANLYIKNDWQSDRIIYLRL